MRPGRCGAFDFSVFKFCMGIFVFEMPHGSKVPVKSGEIPLFWVIFSPLNTQWSEKFESQISKGREENTSNALSA